ADLEAKLSIQLWGSTVCEVKQVTYSRENKVKPPGRLPKKMNDSTILRMNKNNDDPYSKKYNFDLFLIERIMINEEDKYLTKIINELSYFEEISKNKQSKSIFLKKTIICGDILAFRTNIELESFIFKNDVWKRLILMMSDVLMGRQIRAKYNNLVKIRQKSLNSFNY
ncbi:28259_t:CDS:2, partial [Gigaspora margarita]